ncbi:hypothetical protein E2562_003307 [Oryza meyeriana var. granulata]|uniref:Uncharacterized protein n=1 Tax=Oryza meyeriana var. granulata TaxID=110450 RepID=A0A6G1EE70_9ORYZ|nr:hypothetical protein E2562_003307 [Oryza meyeriana var. granulata]
MCWAVLSHGLRTPWPPSPPPTTARRICPTTKAPSRSSREACPPGRRTVSPRWRVILSQPAFLCHHIAPGPLAADDRPRAIIVQPRKLGFTHLALVATDQIPVDVLVRNKYKRPGPSSVPPPQMPGCCCRGGAGAGAGSVWPSEAVDGDHVAFFECTVPALDISIVAAHGRLLLLRLRPSRG